MNNKYYASLRKRFLILIIGVSLTPLVGISWSTAYYFHKHAIKHVTHDLERMVSTRQEIITRSLENQKEQLARLLRLYSSEDLKNQSNLERIFVALSSDSIIDLSVIDGSGNHVAYVGPYSEKLLSQNYKETQWFQDVMHKGSYISDIFSGFREVPHFVVAVVNPLRNLILRTTINSDYYNSLLRGAQISVNGDAFIVNRLGELQTQRRFGEKTISEEEARLLTFHEGTQVNSIKNNLYVTSWMKDGEWLLLVKVKRNSVLKMFLEARNLDIVLLIIASLLIITVSIMIVRQMVNKIAKADYKRASLDSQMLQVEKMASLGRLAAGVAHEVNNPLQLITDQAGWINELMDDEDPKKIKNIVEYQASVKKILNNVKRASAVTHKLLGFSRKMETEKENVDINILVRETVSFVEDEANKEEISINLDLQDEIPATMTDAAQIQQVFFNLINNGMDAVEKGGSIDISTTSDNKNIIIYFADSGPGIADAILDKIFDPFFTTKAPGKGTGLGLSICYSIIKKLGGEINAKNREKYGSVFTVILPIVNLTNRVS